MLGGKKAQVVQACKRPCEAKSFSHFRRDCGGTQSKTLRTYYSNSSTSLSNPQS